MSSQHDRPAAGVNRADFMRATLAASLAVALPGGVMAATGKSAGARMRKRKIASTGEELPVVGCGTWVGFGHAPGTAEYARLPGVLEALFDAGGSLLDSSPMYGRSEKTTGELLAKSSRRAQAFLATKVSMAFFALYFSSRLTTVNSTSRAGRAMA